MKNEKLKQPWREHYDNHVSSHLEYPDLTMVQLFKNTVSRNPQKIFLIHRERQFNYQEIDAQVTAMANQLYANGLRKGDRIAILLPNIPEFVIAYYAILVCGGIVVALNPSYKEYEMDYLLNDASPKMIICLTKHLEILGGFLQKGTLEKIIIVSKEKNNSKKQPNERVIYYDDFLKRSLGEFQIQFPEVNRDDAAIFQYSGGTTGFPKAAIGMHRNLVSNAVQFSVWCRLSRNKEVILTAIPLYHVYGMVLAMNLGVYIGASLVLIDDPREIEFILESIDNYKVTFFPGVPSIYYAINHNNRVVDGEFMLGTIKACISGSAPLHPSIKQEFEKLTHARLMEGYGLSEAPTATHCNPLCGINKEGSIGMPLPDVDCRIVDIETGKKDLGVNQIGELVIKGPQVMSGYFNRSEENEMALKDGWLYTGDVARFDDDGYFFLVDRKKSLIKVNGLQVWPNEVEVVIASNPGVKECAVGGVPDLAQGEKVIAWVVAKEDALLTYDEVCQWCRKYLSGYKVPKEVFFLDAIPRTGVGKILRRVLIEDYLERK